MARRKLRLDVLLKEKGMVSSRNRAQRVIREGEVEVDGWPVTAPSTAVHPAAQICVHRTPPYVSRAGEKLSFALDQFQLDVTGLTVLDGGASTGGFTDCLLQYGARSVCAVDVGRNQMVDYLREDPRVHCLEGANLRWLRPVELPQTPFDMATVDVSFISLTLVLPVLYPLLRRGAPCLVLVKPQFEVGRRRVSKGGVVRGKRAHRDAINQVMRAARDIGFRVCDLVPSPLTGSDGNSEFFVLLWRPPLPEDRRSLGAGAQEGYVVECVEHAHKE